MWGSVRCNDDVLEHNSQTSVLGLGVGDERHEQLHLFYALKLGRSAGSCRASEGRQCGGPHTRTCAHSFTHLIKLGCLVQVVVWLLWRLLRSSSARGRHRLRLARRLWRVSEELVRPD